MTQVSRHPLSKPLEEKLHLLFRKVLADLRNEKDVADFLDDILSPTEKIMLGKRLAIAILIEKGYDHRTIHSILHVSLTTVSTIHYWLKNRGTGYRNVISRILRNGEWNNILSKIADDFESITKPGKHAYYPKIPKEPTSADIL